MFKLNPRLFSPDRIAFNIIGYTMVTFFAVLCIMPFYLIIVASITSEATIMQHGYSFAIREISLEGYMLSLRNPTIVLRAYLNTIVLTVVGTIVAVFLQVMTGFVIARPDFDWRNKFSFFFFFTTLLSGGLTPYYLHVTRNLGFINSYHALLLPVMFPIWNVIIAKSFMRSIPFEIAEAAKIDGAGDFKIFLRVYLPLTTPLLATLGLFTALAYWNDWYNCLLFIRDESRLTLQYFLQRLVSSVDAMRRVAEMSGLDVPFVPIEAMKMSMTVIVTGPIILLYPFMQKYFIKGLTIGAVKG